MSANKHLVLPSYNSSSIALMSAPTAIPRIDR
jgi:hypothetical protein